jgi:transcriptional regulator with XRE-family HTH domain
MSRQKLEYPGFQFKDFLNGLLQDKGILQIDLAKMTKITQKTISEWATGLALPTRGHFQNVILVLAPTGSTEERMNYINENTAIFESIKEQYKIAKGD